MRINAPALSEEAPAAGAKAKILLIHFDGAIDAGGAGRMAIGQMLRSLHNERVATFDADALVDYRSHRPIITVEDWVSSPDMVMPQTVLDLVEDDMGNPILVLHGAEPDAHWESFTNAISGICERAGVEITFSLHGVPSGVPHTRPTPVHVQATDASLLPAGGATIANHMQFPAPLSTFVQIRMGQRGMGGLALLGAVPFYMADTGYPAASSALLTSFAKFADLSLPVGEKGDAYNMEPIYTAGGGYLFGKDANGDYLAGGLGVGGEGSIAAAKKIGALGADGVLRSSITLDNAISLFTDGKAPYLVSGPWALIDFIMLIMRSGSYATDAQGQPLQ